MLQGDNLCACMYSLIHSPPGEFYVEDYIYELMCKMSKKRLFLYNKKHLEST